MKNFLSKILMPSDQAQISMQDFAHRHKNLLVIICDPKTDEIQVTYKDKFVKGKIKAVDGKKLHVVKSMLLESQFDKHIDGFIGSLVETLKLSVMAGGHFYKFLDGALFNISKALSKKSKVKPSPPMPGAVLSPIQKEEITNHKQ